MKKQSFLKNAYSSLLKFLSLLNTGTSIAGLLHSPKSSHFPGRSYGRLSYLSTVPEPSANLQLFNIHLHLPPPKFLLVLAVAVFSLTVLSKVYEVNSTLSLINCLNLLEFPKHESRMNSLRIARATARFIPGATRLCLQNRGYADAVSDKIQLTLALPHQVSTSPDRFVHPPVFPPNGQADYFLTYSLSTNLEMCM